MYWSMSVVVNEVPRNNVDTSSAISKDRSTISLRYSPVKSGNSLEFKQRLKPAKSELHSVSPRSFLQ